MIEDSRVLDLFAGTGALGLEAASRGAKSVDFVEIDKVAFSSLNQNVESARQGFAKTEQQPQLKTWALDAKKFAKQSSKEYDLIFVDPPYELTNHAIAEILANLDGSLATNAVVVIERASRDVRPEVDGLVFEEEKKYGDTAVYLFRKN